MIRGIFRNFYRHSSQPVVMDHKNPYLSLPIPVIKELLSKQLQSKSTSIPHTNTLIYLGTALLENKVDVKAWGGSGIYETILQKCIRNLEKVHENIDNEEEKVLAELQFGQLLGILQKYQSRASFSILNGVTQKLTMLYANTYSHILPFSKHLQIYQKSHIQDYDLIKQISIQRIDEWIHHKILPLNQYIGYLRQFHRQIEPLEIQSQLEKYKNYPSLRLEVNQSQKLILFYILINAKCETTIIKQLGLDPRLEIESKENEKDACLKLEILRYKGKNFGDLNHLIIQRWDYSYLVWISEFANDAQFKSKLHLVLMGKDLPGDSQPSTIFSYANNAKIDGQKHREVNEWLCRQEKICPKNEESLCNMLKQINQKHWEPYYTQFYRLVLKMSLGNFKWESQNIIYYLGHVQNIQDENMQYLRRYILNTYASLGTARREIPTSSYFYKILQVANVQKFYGNL